MLHIYDVIIGKQLQYSANNGTGVLFPGVLLFNGAGRSRYLHLYATTVVIENRLYAGRMLGKRCTTFPLRLLA